MLVVKSVLLVSWCLVDVEPDCSLCLFNVTPYFVPAVHRLLVQYDIKILYSENGGEVCEERNQKKKKGVGGDNHFATVIGMGLVHCMRMCQSPLCL